MGRDLTRWRKVWAILTPSLKLSLSIFTLDLLVLYALAVHGGRPALD